MADMSDEEIREKALLEGKNPNRVLAGVKAARTRRSRSRSISGSENEEDSSEHAEGGKSPKRAGRRAARKAGHAKLPEAGKRGGSRSGRSSASSDEGGLSAEEGHVKDPKRVAAAKKAAATRKRRVQEAKEKASASAEEEESGEPETKKINSDEPTVIEAGKKAAFVEGDLEEENEDVEFLPGQELVEEEEDMPRTDPKTEEKEALEEILEQGKEMGFDPSKPVEHENRTGLHYPTKENKVTEHKEGYIVPEEEEGFPEVEEPKKDPVRVEQGNKAVAGLTHEELSERGRKGVEARMANQGTESLARHE